jgi:hypothetical protein
MKNWIVCIESKENCCNQYYTTKKSIEICHKEVSFNLHTNRCFVSKVKRMQMLQLLVKKPCAFLVRFYHSRGSAQMKQQYLPT